MIAALCALALAAAPDPAAALDAANAAARAGDWAAAERGYAALLADGWESPALHVNRGAALLRLGRRGAAVASFERALRLAPGDPDARADLAIARAANVDRVLGTEERSFTARVVARAPDGAATAAFVVPWFVLWIALALRRRAPHRAREPLAIAAVAAAILAAGGGALLAAKAAERATPTAIVTADATAVRDAPSRTLRAAFELHEGTKVRVLEVKGDELRVRLGNGLEGWIASEAVEGI